MMVLSIYIGLGTLLGAMASFGCLWACSKFAAERDRRLKLLEQQADRAKREAEREEQGLARLSPAPQQGGGAAAAAAAIHRDSLRAPLLGAIPEDTSEGGHLPIQSHDELPQCVQTFLNKAIRDGRRFKLFTLHQTGQLKLDPKGGWKETTAVQRACPLEPAFVWSATASLAPLVTIKGCDSFVDASGFCTWQLWGAVPAASGGGREVEQSLRVRWLAEAVCFPQALRPSRFLRWEAVKGEPQEAEAVLTHAGVCVRATFTFDRWGRVARMRSTDFLRRLPNGAFEAGEWQVSYSGHMLFGLSPQGEVMQEEMATHAGVFVPTNVEASWIMPDSSRWVYAKMTVSKVLADI